MSTDLPAPIPIGLRNALAAALRGEKVTWPKGPEGDPWAAAMPRALLYHGVAGLLVAKPDCLQGWPRSVTEDLRDQARAGAMWELRHRDVLGRLLAAFAEHGVRVLVMKGSALAYGLYQRPADRPRGDSDLLVAEQDAPLARQLLDRLGYAPFAAGESFEWLQEGWTLSYADGTDHAIDLHWAVLNAHALADVLPAAECLANARPLPGLCPQALQMDAVRTMLHLCLHRALHRTAPYLLGDEAFFGGDRLIWSVDIHLLADSFDEGDWDAFTGMAAGRRVAGACLEALTAARDDLGAAIPESVLEALQRAASGDRLYLRSHRALAREWQNFRAMPGWGQRLRYLRSRLLPEGAFLRGKYPGMAGAPLPLLYVRRFADALRRRAASGSQQ